MSCINRGLSITHDSWICFCPEGGKTAWEMVKETVNPLCGSYLDYLHSKMDSLTELDCQRALRKMEDIANDNFHRQLKI
jgi:hypothetical protein